MGQGLPTVNWIFFFLLCNQNLCLSGPIYILLLSVAYDHFYFSEMFKVDMLIMHSI